MITSLALMLAVVTMPSPNPADVSPTSQSFADRVTRLQGRIADDAQRKLFAPGQQTLLNVQLDTARQAQAKNDPTASDMLDVIDRQLAEADYVLSRAEDGRSITVHVGDSVVVAMHDPYFWNVENSDQTVLAPKIGLMWMRGVQAGYTAKQPGTAILSLTPKPKTNFPPGVNQPVVFTITVLPTTVK